MLEVTAAMLTDRGLVRSSNEDAVAYVMPQEAGGVALAVLADGMGGHSAGEIASAIAIETILERFFQEPDIEKALAFCLDAANTAIRDRAEADPACAGMGTTCTMLAIDGADAWLAHIGDSRAYFLRGGRFEQISEDHSVVARLLQDKLITPEAALTHPDRHAILQALGTATDISPQYLKILELQPGDRFLLCSDGLSDLVAPADMLQAIAENPPIDACRALIAAALASGGVDNISVGVIALGDPEQLIASPGNITRPLKIEPDGAAP